VLAYACPLPRQSGAQAKLIILITGDSGVGKDHCAHIWLPVLNSYAPNRLSACVVSISDATKREYAAAANADASRLLWDREYKEQHRPALTQFFQDQVQQRPSLPEEHFLNVLHDAGDANVVLVTGMRDRAPVAALSHLIPGHRLLEVRVTASEKTRDRRRGCLGGDIDGNSYKNLNDDLVDRPSLLFDNEPDGDVLAKRFAEQHLLTFFHDDAQALANMVRMVPGFPRSDIQFRHVLDISQQKGGLALCTSLLQTRFAGDWAEVDVVACCEAGGFVYASAVASRLDLRLALIRQAGKLPPPTISVPKSSSHISSSPSDDTRDTIEIGRNVIPPGASVVVVDDVFATGETLCAVLRLLQEAGVDADNISVMVVAEFPAHRGRKLLLDRGFGRVQVQSLLVFGGA
jgi:adenine phosphoribosyltransferase/phosphomevalonate kinase